MIDVSHLATNGKMIFLACDQGMEHGPTDFNEKNIDPRYICEIGVRNGLNALIFGRGIAEKYYPEYAARIPLILKLNGHTRYNKPNSWGPQNCTVAEAKALGAAAVGYTIHLGSLNEYQMLSQFGTIVREAHEQGLPAMAWIYPRGPEITEDKSPEMTAYAARLGLELGADIVKVYHSGDVGSLRWAGMAAGRTKTVVSGGDHVDIDQYIAEAKMVAQAGLDGIAVGRNVWQSEDPDAVCARLKDIFYNGNLA